MKYTCRLHNWNYQTQQGQFKQLTKTNNLHLGSHVVDTFIAYSGILVRVAECPDKLWLRRVSLMHAHILLSGPLSATQLRMVCLSITCIRSISGDFRALGVFAFIYHSGMLGFCNIFQSFLPCIGELCSCSSIEDGEIPRLHPLPTYQLFLRPSAHKVCGTLLSCPSWKNVEG